MASFSCYSFAVVLSFFVLNFRHINGEYSNYSNSSFDFKNFSSRWSIESQFSMYGDAKLVDVDMMNMSVEISGSVVSSAGRLVSKTPFKLFQDGNPRKFLISFATTFVFSMSTERRGDGDGDCDGYGDGDGLAFVMAPKEYPTNEFDGGSFGLLVRRNKLKFIAVEFDSNHVGIDVDSLVSVKRRNVSSINLIMNGDKKLQAWIDYEASSKRLEVRLSKFGEIRPLDPFISYPIDLGRVFLGENEVFVALSSSSSGNSSYSSSTQKCNVHSWSLNLRPVPYWMHSEPLDPVAYVEKKEKKIKNRNVHRKSDCVLKVLAALIFGTGCGALGAFVVLFLWTVMGNKRPVVPEDYAVQPVEFKKAKAVVDEAIEVGKNYSMDLRIKK